MQLQNKSENWSDFTRIKIIDCFLIIPNWLYIIMSNLRLSHSYNWQVEVGSLWLVILTEIQTTYVNKNKYSLCTDPRPICFVLL